MRLLQQYQALYGTPAALHPVAFLSTEWVREAYRWVIWGSVLCIKHGMLCAPMLQCWASFRCMGAPYSPCDGWVPPLPLVLHQQGLLRWCSPTWTDYPSQGCS